MVKVFEFLKRNHVIVTLLHSFSFFWDFHQSFQEFLDINDFFLLFFSFFFFDEIVELVSLSGILRFFEGDSISKNPVEELTVCSTDGIEGSINLEVESIGVIWLESFLCFGLALGVLYLKDCNVEASILNGTINLLEILIRVHVLEGIISLGGLYLDGIDFLPWSKLEIGLVEHLSQTESMIWLLLLYEYFY